MKKSIFISIVVLLILSIATSVSAYSTSDYTVDLPDNFEEVSTAVFTAENGNGFNVQTTPYDEKAGDPYTEKMLNDLEKEIYSGIEKQKSEIKKQMKLTYGSSVTDAEIEEYISSFKCNSIDVKEITKCTKNNYKCFHLVSNYTMGDYDYYCDQYSIVSGNKIYTLTLSAQDKKDFENEDMKGIINSFTIKNYKEPKNTMSPTLIGAITGGIVGIVLAIVSAIKNKKNKQNS